MSYTDIADMAGNGDLRERIAACAAIEGVTDPHPRQWADQNQWEVVAKSDWEAAWQYAREVGTIERLGRDEGVINDGMILAAVQPLIVGQPAT
jgi:hypothetical protein